MYKTILLLILFKTAVCNCFGQTPTVKLWYDKDWAITSDSMNAPYYRLAEENAIGYWSVTDYYRNGILQMEGVYIDKTFEIESGIFRYYNEDGVLRLQRTFQNGLKIGEEFEFYKNGEIYKKTDYSNFGKQIDLHFYSEDGTELPWFNAEFIGGKEAMYDFISSNLKFPKSAVRGNSVTRVITAFYVETMVRSQIFRFLNPLMKNFRNRRLMF